MPPGYVIVDARKVRGPDGREHDVLDAIRALKWTPQLCPLMRHEYTIWKKDREPDWPEWAWNVLSSMLLASNTSSFKAYFRGYATGNRYWDAPDGLRYWRGRHEIDRGQPDGAGLVVAPRPKPEKDWDGPPWAPDGIGLYDRDERGRWWPTEAALASGYQPCRWCQQTRKSDIVASPMDPDRVAAVIAAAENDTQTKLARPMTREELGQELQRYEDGSMGPYSRMQDRPTEVDASPSDSSVSGRKSTDVAGSVVRKDRIVRKLLELRAREAPLGSTGYRGVLSQKAIADVADVQVRDVTKAAIAMDQESGKAGAEEVE